MFLNRLGSLSICTVKFFQKILCGFGSASLSGFIVQQEYDAATEVDDVAKAIADAFQDLDRIIAALGEAVVVASLDS